jgi:hypothetical protein
MLHRHLTLVIAMYQLVQMKENNDIYMNLIPNCKENNYFYSFKIYPINNNKIYILIYI